MYLQEYYNFENKEYDKEGVHIKTRKWFLILVAEFEEDFHEKFPHCFANYLFANYSTMLIFNRAIDLDINERSGMELIDGEIDLDANLEIEKYSNKKTVYAIGSRLEENHDEPIFLITDDRITDGLLILKYIPDSDSEDSEIEMPVGELVKTI